MQALTAAFEASRAQNRAALVTQVTAGFPSVNATPEIMLGMQAGGTDIIEIGIPFKDPITDSPFYQSINTIAFDNGVRIPAILQIVKTARSRGLTVPVVLMGHREPIREYAFGEEKLLRDCKAAGVDGFVIVDFPHDEAVRFSSSCKAKGLSYIPVIALTTPESHMQTLCKSATSFVFLVSHVGSDGVLADPDEGLPGLLKRVQRYAKEKVPTVIGSCATNSQQFLRLARLAEGVAVEGSLGSILESAAPGTMAQKVKEYCLKVADRAEAHVVIPPKRQPVHQSMSPTTVYLSSSDGTYDCEMMSQ